MFREWLTKNASKTIEAAVEPTKKAIQQAVETKSDWATKLLRLGIAGFLAFLAFREEPRGLQEKASGGTPNITINNYIHEGGLKNDSEH